MPAKISLCKFDFVKKSDSGKTKIWKVMEPGGEYEIGYIKWHGPWRCYVFEPLGYTIYEKNCLRAIANFCEHQNKETRSSWRKKK